jgi:isopentenyl-diphosphate delta-isomerase
MYSCCVLSPSGRVLLARRALDAQRWPGLWMASWWGTCRPDQDAEQAMTVGVRVGLGIRVTGVRPLARKLRYDIGFATGPVFAGVTRDLPRPDPARVIDWHWLDPPDLLDLIRVAAWTLCPWTVELGALAFPGDVVRSPAA